MPVHQVVSDPAANQQLDSLHEQYAVLKGEAEEAGKRLSAVKDAIKVALTQAVPEGVAKVELIGPEGSGRRPLSLAWTVSSRLNTRRLKAEEPDLYEVCTEAPGSWVLR